MRAGDRSYIIYYTHNLYLRVIWYLNKMFYPIHVYRTNRCAIEAVASMYVVNVPRKPFSFSLI